MSTINLAGHSGCRLLLENIDDVFYVRKSAKNVEYNKRLELQAGKQKAFCSKHLCTPKIDQEGYDEQGIYFFRMEYVSGATLANAFRTISLEEIDRYVELFMNLVPKDRQPDHEAPVIFKNKIKGLSDSIAVKNRTIDQSFHILENYHWDIISQSYCHGDLTLENILVSDNKLYLIDFLDSFYDSWMVDFAKLFQDLEVFWSYRNDGKLDINLQLRLLVLKDRLLQKLMQLDKGEDYIDGIYHILLLNILRIIPYTSDEDTMQWLNRKLHHLNKRIRKKEYI